LQPAACSTVSVWLQVRVLEEFSPTDEWLLRPGDALYLPPRYAHHGVSEHADCVTYSVGFRAPSRAELLRGLAAHVARRLPEDDMYTDADLALQEPGHIDEAAVGRVRAMLRETLEEVLQDERAFEEWVGRALTAPRRAPLGAVPAWSALEAAAAAEEAEAEAAKVEAQAAVQAAAQAVAQADEEAGDSKAWGVAAVVSEIAGGGEDVLCHTPGRIFGFVDHAGVHSQADDDGDDESPGGPRGAARSMFVDGERVPVAPGAAPFVPLLCSNSRLPPAVLRGPLRGSPALRRLVCELLRRDFLSVDVEL